MVELQYLVSEWKLGDVTRNNLKLFFINYMFVYNVTLSVELWYLASLLGKQLRINNWTFIKMMIVFNVKLWCLTTYVKTQLVVMWRNFGGRRSKNIHYYTHSTQRNYIDCDLIVLDVSEEVNNIFSRRANSEFMF